MTSLTALPLDPIFGANEILNLTKCQICLYCLVFFLVHYLDKSRKEIKQLLECSTQMLERSSQRLERVRRMAEELERESEELAQENNNLAQENSDIAKNDDGSFTSEWDTDEKYNEELSESEYGVLIERCDIPDTEWTSDEDESLGVEDESFTFEWVTEQEKTEEELQHDEIIECCDQFLKQLDDKDDSTLIDYNDDKLERSIDALIEDVADVQKSFAKRNAELKRNFDDLKRRLDAIEQEIFGHSAS